MFCSLFLFQNQCDVHNKLLTYIIIFTTPEKKRIPIFSFGTSLFFGHKTVDKAEGKCAFPAWVASHHWHTLDGKISAKMHHKNSTMHITEDNRRNSSGHYSLSGGGSSLGLSGLPLLGSGSAGISLGGIGAVGVAAGTNAGTSGGLFSASSSLSSSLFTGGTRIVCQSRVDIVEGRHVAIVAKHTQGW